MIDRAQQLIERHPSVYMPIARRKWRRLAISSDTEIVIEGFPRSANTFAVTAFESAQTAPVRVAHHLHAPAQVIVAARTGVPVLLLIREPRAAITSAVARKPELVFADVTRRYIGFHEAVEPWHEQFVVADFDQVTGDFGAVTRRINERFGTAFRPFVHTDENVRDCFARIDDASERRVGRLDGQVVARPTSDKMTSRAELERRYATEVPAEPRGTAQGVYRRFRELAGW